MWRGSGSQGVTEAHAPRLPGWYFLGRRALSQKDLSSWDRLVFEIPNINFNLMFPTPFLFFLLPGEVGTRPPRVMPSSLGVARLRSS